jgi:hypothetical protein
MVPAALRDLVTRFREWYAVSDPNDRIEGSEEVDLDRAYNGRYEADREMRRLSRVAADGDEDQASRANAVRRRNEIIRPTCPSARRVRRPVAFIFH